MTEFDRDILNKFHNFAHHQYRVDLANESFANAFVIEFKSFYFWIFILAVLSLSVSVIVVTLGLISRLALGRKMGHKAALWKTTLRGISWLWIRGKTSWRRLSVALLGWWISLLTTELIWIYWKWNVVIMIVYNKIVGMSVQIMRKLILSAFNLPYILFGCDEITCLSLNKLIYASTVLKEREKSSLIFCTVEKMYIQF